MVKIPTFDELKAKMPKFDDLKGMLGSCSANRAVLPDDLKKRMDSVDQKLQAFSDLHKKLDEAAIDLKKETALLCQEAIGLYTPPKENSKPEEK